MQMIAKAKSADILRGFSRAPRPAIKLWGFTGCGKRHSASFRGKESSAGAEALIDFAALSARLKSCPVTKRLFERRFTSFFRSLFSSRGKVLSTMGISSAAKAVVHLERLAAWFPEGARSRAFKATGFMAREAFSAILLGCGIALLAASVSARSQKAPSAALYRIAGTVVNAVTGEPVRGASVAVLAHADSRTVASAISGNDGHFAFDGLPAAKYQLTASRRGYCTGFYDQHEEFNSAIVTGPDQGTGSLVFRLMPGAVLRGVVTADGGDTVEGATVSLFAKPHGHEPGAKITQEDTATTDDTGAYEFSNLTEGEYLLAVKADPWYAMHGAASAGTALDVAYPVTYFDSTTDEASAVPIALAGGSSIQANINLHAVPALHLAVEAPRRQDGTFTRPELRQTIFGAEVPEGSAGFTDATKAGGGEFTGVAPGRYELTQGDPPRVALLDAAASQQVDPAVGTPAVVVAGNVESAPGAALVTLEPLDAAQGLRPLQSDVKHGAFRFPVVPAGVWILHVANAAGFEMQVVMISAVGRTRAGNRLTVQDRPLFLVVRASEGTVRVEGFARKEGKGQAGVMVVLVPKNMQALPQLARRDQSDSDGSFSLLNVVAGQYTVVAIEDGWTLDWSRLDVIGRYLPGGVPVTVTGAQGKAVRLSAPVPVQSP
jgi:uncharacterized protein (DUF2141 family)